MVVTSPHNKITKKGFTALHYGSVGGYEAVVVALVRANVDVTVKNRDGKVINQINQYFDPINPINQINQIKIQINQINQFNQTKPPTRDNIKYEHRKSVKTSTNKGKNECEK